MKRATGKVVFRRENGSSPWVVLLDVGRKKLLYAYQDEEKAQSKLTELTSAWDRIHGHEESITGGGNAL